MRIHFGIALLSALALLAGGACTRVQQPAGSVTLNFSTGQPETRAGNGVVADGGGIYRDGNDIPDLKILLVDANGNVVARYPDSGQTPQSLLVSSTATNASVKFTSIPQGEYQVYAAANTGSSLTVSGVDWETISTKGDLNALKFTTLEGNNPPTIADNGRMPLSAVGPLSVKAGGNGQASLQLLRCVAKVEITFKNLTGNALSLTNCNITLNSINPNSGYLFQPAGDDATGTIRDLTLASGKTLTFTSTGDDQTQTVGPMLVFPSQAPANPGYYKCNVSFTYNETAMNFNNLPVHDNKSKNITSLGRNQYLKIEIRISNQTNISFNFEVSDWTPKTESVTFH